jgi:hypothetical protein
LTASKSVEKIPPITVKDLSFVMIAPKKPLAEMAERKIWQSLILLFFNSRLITFL